MNIPTLHKLNTNTIFERISTSYTKEEYAKRVQKIVYMGLQPTITIWRNTVVKGYDDYKICQKWNIPFFIEELEMDELPEVTSWLCLESIKTKNLTPSHLRYCVGKLYKFEKQRQITDCPLHNQFYQSQPYKKSKNPSRERVVELVKDYIEIRPGTVYTYFTYSAAVDELDEKVPGTAKQLLNEQITLSQTMVLKIAKYPAEEIAQLFSQILAKNDTVFLCSEKKRKLEITKQHINNHLPDEPAKKKLLPEIKNMPQYDPDAEISSVTLTIPMWINSLKRAKKNAKLSEISDAALKNIQLQLKSLQLEINYLQTAIQEEQNERNKNN